jgi:endonuclease/exonuclease/phosphatase family metal-dependent hydrolase
MRHMRLQIATYNIHKGVSALRGKPRIFAIKEAIAGLRADLVFLQEVQGRHDRNAAQFGNGNMGGAHWPEQSQHAFLAGDSHHSAYGMNAVYEHGHHGNALLSVFPIASVRNQDVSDHAYEQRGILHCVLQAQGVEVHCYVVHLGLFAAGRGRQTEALIKVVANSAPPGAPVIIAGDFNDWRNHLGDALRTALGVIEVFDERRSGSRMGSLWRNLKGGAPKFTPARTFPAALPWLRLDRIYVRGFTVEMAEVLHGPQWGKLSDHAPIVATLHLTAALPPK